MIFEALYDSALHDELILIDGGFCRFHVRGNGQLTIYEIISIRQGAGSEMLEILKAKKPLSIFAKCPIDLQANEWYRRKGFMREGVETIRSGRRVNLWRLSIAEAEINDSRK